jgi:hypothetical protein
MRVSGLDMQAVPKGINSSFSNARDRGEERSISMEILD